MTVNDIKGYLDCQVFCGENELNREVHTACGSDMMSDVLAYVKDQSVLLTGLCNPQAVRTAEMMDIVCIVFVRGKQPDESMISLGRDRGLVMLGTKMKMFQACGILYEKGLRGGVTHD